MKNSTVVKWSVGLQIATIFLALADADSSLTGSVYIASAVFTFITASRLSKHD